MVDQGAVRLDGKALTRVDPADVVRAGVVQVPEGRRVFADLTVEENLRAGGLSSQGPREQGRGARPRVRAVPAARRSAAPSAPACSPAASSRCSPSAAR